MEFVYTKTVRGGRAINCKSYTYTVHHGKSWRCYKRACRGRGKLLTGDKFLQTKEHDFCREENKSESSNSSWVESAYPEFFGPLDLSTGPRPQQPPQSETPEDITKSPPIVTDGQIICKYGCGQLLSQGHELHETICKFRPIVCHQSYKTKCNGKLVPFKDYFNHMKSSHDLVGEVDGFVKSRFIPTQPFTVLDSSSPELNGHFTPLYKREGNTVLFSNVAIRNGIIECWMSMIGGEEKAEGHFVKITLFDERFPKFKIETLLRAHSIRASADDIRKSGYYLELPFQIFIELIGAEDQRYELNALWQRLE